jgi:hypothetical protein
MAYQKLQQLRAITVIPSDSVIPMPGGEVASGTTAAIGASVLLAPTGTTFLGKVTAGAVAYNTTTNKVANVIGIEDDKLFIDDNIFFVIGDDFIVYNIQPNIGPVLYVGGTGDLDIITAGGDAVVMTGVQAGTVLPIMVSKVLDTATTTATNIVALW